MEQFKILKEETKDDYVLKIFGIKDKFIGVIRHNGELVSKVGPYDNLFYVAETTYIFWNKIHGFS